MKLKLDDEGKTVLNEGKPVYVDDGGKEYAFDAAQMYGKIGELTRENKSHRERADALEGQLKNFKGIDDPEAALKALATVKNLDQKKLVDAGQVETVKAEAIKATEEKYLPVVQRAKQLETELYAEKIGGAFSRSKFIAEKCAVPTDLVEARFGGNFKIEDGKTVAFDHTGNKVYSKARPGEPADFEEALEIIVDQYPYKDQILKGSGQSGTNSKPVGNGGGQHLSKKKSDFKSEKERAAFVTEHGLDAYKALPA